MKKIIIFLAALSLLACSKTEETPSSYTPPEGWPYASCGTLDIPVVGGGTLTKVQFSALDPGADTGEDGRHAYCILPSPTDIGYSDTLHCYISLLPGTYANWEIAMEMKDGSGCISKGSDTLFVATGDTVAVAPCHLNDAEGLLSLSFSCALDSCLRGDVPFIIDQSAGTASATIDYYAGIRSMAPVFELEDGWKMLCEGELQKSGVSRHNFYKPVVYTLVSPEGLTRRITASVDHYTGGPVLIIDTPDGCAISSKEIWVDSTHIRLDGAGIYDDYESWTDCIKGRGNATWNKFPKKPYNIKLDSPHEMLGMPSNKRWSLLANYRDRTRICNGIALHVGQNLESLPWTSHCEYVSVILNGEEKGLYQFTEQIRVGKDRVDVDEFEIDDEGNYTNLNEETITGGYLLQIDSYYDEPYKFRTNRYNLPCELKHPNENVPIEVMSYIKGYFDEVESYMAVQNWDKVHELIDIDSFVDFWLCVSIMGCGDNGRPGSDFVHKQRMGKLYAGPIWDYDGCCNDTNFRISKTLWYPYLIQDPYFCEVLKEHWEKYQPFVDTIPSFIDSLAERIKRERLLDDYLWVPGIGFDVIHGNEFLDYPDAISRQKNWLAAQRLRVDEKVKEYFNSTHTQ